MKTLILLGLMTLNTSAFASSECDYAIDQAVARAKSHNAELAKIDAFNMDEHDRDDARKFLKDLLDKSVAHAKAECTPH